MRRSRRYLTIGPCAIRAVLEYNRAAASASTNGMYLSGNPGIVHAMQMPPTFGHPPTPLVQPRIATLHLTTGPLHPSLTRQRPSPCALENWPASAIPARLQPS